MPTSLVCYEIISVKLLAGDMTSIPELGRSHGEGSGNPHENSCLENSMDRGAWWATIHEVAKSQTRLVTSVLVIVINMIIMWT